MIALAALICAAMFAGGALCLTLGESGGRRSGALLAALSGLGGVLGVLGWWRYQSNWFWLGGGVVLLLALVTSAGLLRSRPSRHGAAALLGLVAVALIGRGILP